MIGEWIAKAWVNIAGISVVHSIPGRLRVHFAGGAKAREFFQKQGDDIPEKVFLYKLRGIDSFDFNPLSSKALIVYDPDKLSEKDIISWLKRLQELIVQSVMKGERKVNQNSIDRIASQLIQEGYALEKFEQRTTA